MGPITFKPSSIYQLLTVSLSLLMIFIIGSLFRLNETSLKYPILIIFISIFFFFIPSIYAFDNFTINNNLIYNKKYFFKRKFTIDSLSAISYVTGITGGGIATNSLNIIFYKDNKEKKIQLYEMQYSRSTLSKVAAYLLKIKPSIKIDSEARKLIA